MKIDLRTAAVIVLPVILFGAGCMHGKAVVKNTFLLDAQRDDRFVHGESMGILAVQPFSIAPAFEGKGVVSRIGENKYESDYYNEYFVSPAQMMTERARNWLSQSGLFAQVLPPVSCVEPTYVLEGHVKQMVMDVRSRTAAHAVLEIQFFLLQQQSKHRVIQFQKTYTSIQLMESASFQDYMAAQNWGLRNMLSTLESDLASQL